jgi:epoxide hydrolase 4
VEQRDLEVAGGDTRFFVRTFEQPDRRPAVSSAEDAEDLALLLHGWPEDGSSWRRVVPLLTDAGYRVACPDLKGFGRSDTPVRGYDAETLADEVSQLVRNLGARKAVLVGHDWGGAVALATAFRHPGRVRALVVASSPFRQLDLLRSWNIPLMNLPVAPAVAFRVAARPLVRGAVLYAARVTEPFEDEVLDAYARAVAVRPRAWLSYYRTLSRRVLVERAVRQVRSRVAFLRDPEGPHRLRVPAMVVWGDDDPVTPHHLGVRVAQDLDIELVTVPGVGHFVHEEDPRAVAAAVLRVAGPAVPDADEPGEQAG